MAITFTSRIVEYAWYGALGPIQADFHLYPKTEQEEALRWAARNGHTNVVSWLLKQGVDGKTLDEYALRWAARHGHLDIVQILVEHGSNTKIHDDEPFRWAADHGFLSVVVFLISKGANIHSHNDWAIRGAARDGHLDVLHFLFTQGANLHAQNEYVLRHAAELGRNDIIEWCLQHNADIHANEDEALCFALKEKHFDTATLLLKNGASYTNGLAFAQALNNPEILEYILDVNFTKTKPNSHFKKWRDFFSQSIFKQQNNDIVILQKSTHKKQIRPSDDFIKFQFSRLEKRLNQNKLMASHQNKESPRVGDH